MRSHLAAVLAGMALPSVPTSASAQVVQQLTPFYRVVEHGRSLKVANYGVYDPSCRPLGLPTVSLLTAPQGGEISVGTGTDFPSYPATNPRFACDKRRLPSTQLFYRAAPSFSGADTFTVEVVYPPGDASQYKYTVNVR